MPHSFRVKVYYEDTDAGGVVYYGKYLGYLERARTEFLAEHGINVAELHNAGYLFAVTHVDIRYKRPAMLGETVEVTTEVVELKNVSLTLENRILRGGELLVEAKVTFACIGSDRKLRRLPDGFGKLKG